MLYYYVNNTKTRKNTPPPKKEIGVGVFHILNTLSIPRGIELRMLIRSLKVYDIRNTLILHIPGHLSLRQAIYERFEIAFACSSVA